MSQNLTVADIHKAMRPHALFDSLMNGRREPLTPWERGLRPAKSSNRVLHLALVLAAALVGFAWSQGWLTFVSKVRTEARQGAPTPLRPGAVAPATVPPSPSTSASREGPSPRIQHVTRCVTTTGQATYSDVACPAGARATLVEVRPDINLADGMSSRAREVSMRENRVAAQELVAHERRVAMNVDSTVFECSQLESLIASLDAAARQPLNGYQQDRLRGERKHARDRQFALRCR